MLGPFPRLLLGEKDAFNRIGVLRDEILSLGPTKDTREYRQPFRDGSRFVLAFIPQVLLVLPTVGYGCEVEM